MSKIIFHIDVNSAFLSWTALEELKAGSSTDLRTIPSIIGGDQSTRHGIVLAKSLPAKAYGIHTAEPVASALKKCPYLVMVSPCHEKYREYSRQLMDLLRTYTPDIEQVSIDECYMDFEPIAHHFPSPEQAARIMADRVRNELGFTVNVGISNCKILAKMASDMEKPDKVHTLWPWEIEAKMWPLPVGDLHMVGHSAAARLNALGIHTIGQLAAADPDFLQSHFHSHGKIMWEYANGIDNRTVDPDERIAASVGNSVTLSEDCTSRKEALKILRSLSEKVAGRLRKHNQLGGSVQIDIKYSDFRRVSRQAPLLSPTDNSLVIYEEAERLFNERWSGEPIRLLGVGTSHLVNPGEPVQLSLFDLEPNKDGTPFDTGRHTLSKPGIPPLTDTEFGSPADAVPPAQTDTNSPAQTDALITAQTDTLITAQTDTLITVQTKSSSPFHTDILSSSGEEAADPNIEHAARLKKQRKLEEAMDKLRSRYGQDVISRGKLRDS